MSLRTRSQGTVMCTPLAGRMLSGWVPSSRARTSSDQTPVALTMMEAATSMVLAVGLDGGTGDRAVGVLGDAPQGGPVDDRGAVVQRGGAGHREHEAGVVGLGVVVEVAPGQPVTAQRGHVRHGLVGREALVQLPDAQAAGEVVHPHGRAHRSGQAPADEAVLGEDGDEEGQHVDQVGRRAAEDLALAQRLVDEADLAAAAGSATRRGSAWTTCARCPRRSRPARPGRCAGPARRRRGPRPPR